MLDLEARDYGRLVAWESDQGTVRLPAVAHVHTTRHPAPGFASLVLGRERHAKLPTIQVQGTIFTPRTPKDPDEALPQGLIYPGAAGSSLQEAADDVNAPGGTFQLANRPEALADGPGMAVLVGARFVANDPWRLPAYLVEARRRAGPNPVLFLPGIGRPDQMALAAYCGVDIFDGLVPVIEAKKGQLLTPEGPLPRAEVTEDIGGSPAAFEAMDEGWTSERLLRHNQWVAEAEARRIRMALEHGTLRELVEQRVHAAPEHLAVLRRLDQDHRAWFEQQAPILRERGMPILSRESLGRPEIHRWVERLETRYTPPRTGRVLVVLPCSATKPYENSPTHSRMRAQINKHGKGVTHVVTLTSPLGGVPEELEHAYPAAHYDIPVTGSWYPEEVDLVERAFQAIHKAGQYDAVIHHGPREEGDLLEALFPDMVRTVPDGGHPTDGRALSQLADAVVEAARPHESVP
ncbi:MAG: DUF5591 domain-containing protein, partial [Candidatus Thermoplasmatota archaeon]|nr:DUF5591 domain-containing protein [Candidatus Thermoplasmatota archaeon]